MPDLFDHASGIETQFTEVALANQLAASARAKAAPVYTHTECAECGDTIPAARRKQVPQSTTCTHCQQAHEIRVRRLGGR
ncbi:MULTISPECIES: TraR/DksA C4-type zinc finger protein [Grimontia]|uniref:TraR/DksA C4-type zinc finger protein n=1 Tax=Grimontia TaxID=246861 RepID=UPI000786CCB9|nr:MULTISPECIES: TraR/DksA C4-type zinc finger protein [Grimontia]WRV96519.1 TraR/DksA C4-type zinc finger protein [Grimontia sp. NTOU-MAR1]